tara:strand:- start:10583 stop:10864 length:282 start_codon:yes stop_codon:yes gene_type:complete
MRTLKQIADSHPALIFQNDGYEYIRRHNLSEEDKKAFDEVGVILKDKVREFVKFYNFKLRKSTGEVCVRFDGYYDESFVGVFYVPVSEIDPVE